MTASADDVIGEFEKLPLPMKMRAAARVLESARDYYHDRPENASSPWLATLWTASDLRRCAAEWDKPDPIEELAEFLCSMEFGVSLSLATPGARAVSRHRAGRLYENGYRKEE